MHKKIPLTDEWDFSMLWIGYKTITRLCDRIKSLQTFDGLAFYQVVSALDQAVDI